MAKAECDGGISGPRVVKCKAPQGRHSYPYHRTSPNRAIPKKGNHGAQKLRTEESRFINMGNPYKRSPLAFLRLSFQLGHAYYEEPLTKNEQHSRIVSSYVGPLEHFRRPTSFFVDGVKFCVTDGEAWRIGFLEQERRKIKAEFKTFGL